MKEIIIGVLLFIGAVFFVAMIASFIGRAQVYTDKEMARKLDQCVSAGISYAQCYQGIYNDISKL
jgi:hypothetical protein